MPDIFEDDLAALLALADGLLWMSESDYPFEPFAWQGAGPPTPETLLAALALPADTPVERRTIRQLFANVSRKRAWMDDAARANVVRFAALRDAILERLQKPVAYRVGTIEIAVIIVGKASNGQFVGLRTTVIET